VSRLLRVGRRPLVRSLDGGDAARVAKRYVEEGLEAFEYLVALGAALCAWLA
jgi:hypothetical protein